jgi:MYXO-CTERM domain-containing protein
MEAISDNIMGPYVYQQDCYSKNTSGNDMGHNVTALILPSGSNPYTLIVDEIVPSQMFSSSSPNGPWTSLGNTQFDANGHNGCGTGSNQTFTIGPDMRLWGTNRAGCIMDSDAILGPYKMETDSIFPNLENGDNGNAEDPVIWYSGGYYHIVYDYWDVQRSYHIMSKDGINNWTSTGLAEEAGWTSPLGVAQPPENSNRTWLRYTDGTVNTWHNFERSSVYQETSGGHVTHFTFAVTDVNKNGPDINSAGSKIIVVPFNGVQFDCDNGDQASCDEVAAGGDAGTGGGGNDGDSGVGGAGGGTGGGGASGLGGTDGGTQAAAGGVGGNPGTGGRTGAGGAGGTSSTSPSGGTTGSGGALVSGGGGGSGGAGGAGGSGRVGGASGSSARGGSGGAATGGVGQGGGGSGGSTGSSSSGTGSAASGCSCTVGGGASPRSTSLLLLLGVVAALLGRRRARLG